MSLLFIGIAGFLGMFAGGCISKQTSFERQPVYLGAGPNFEKMKSFQSLIKLTPDSPDYEKNRIEYLFERMKQTRYNFVRNDEVYSHTRALMHLKWKYLRYRNEFNTAESYIRNVASGSRITGEPYFIKVSDTEFYTIESILMNELKILDDAVVQYRVRLKEEEDALALAKKTSDLQKLDEKAVNSLAV